ncbi:MAG: ATP-binding protein, partial [Anaerolineales bacterium]
FRQRDVLAIYRWLPELGVVLAVEQDRMETFSTIFETLGINLVIVTISLVVAIALSMVIVRDIVQPITDLAETATRIAAGDLDQTARVNQTDEIGILASAFNSMTAQLRELITNLEKRVADRTQELERLALQLETSARVGREITSILEINELLGKVSEMIRVAFDYYGVHIFLLDEQKNQLVFNGTWENKPYHFTLEVGQDSLNGKAALLNQAILVNDVKLEPSYRMDYHYPDTQAELVVPLRIGNRVIGTLDILSTEKNAFNPDDALVVQSLGDQIAIAIENARLYERSRELAVLEERNRMARELHDSMNQSLYSVILFTGAASNEANQIGSRAIQIFLERAENMAKQALKEMRLLVYELRPLELEEKGFLGALQQRLDTVEGRAGINVELKINQQAPLPFFLEDALFRIVQEALNNIVKHSNATKVTIEMDIAEEKCKMRVVDNGKGFDPASIQTRHGMGLINMRERAEKLGGKLLINSIPLQGTEIEFEIDLRLSA